jgi:SAM-dependent methyltransferase
MTRRAGFRPFYTEYAWAFDLLIDRPVRKECAVITRWLIERGVLPGAELLDAGCGTGRYTLELARRGYVARGIDMSPELIDVAKRSAADPMSSSLFAIGDILALPAARYDAILCRGVLNDFLEDDERDRALVSLSQALRPDGVLILDVRDWETSAVRKRNEPLFTKRVETERGQLTFTSMTTVDAERHRLVLSERHTLIHAGHERSSDHVFVMRCWTRAELEASLLSNGFRQVTYFGAYDPSVETGQTDRIVAIAHRTLRTR